MRLTQNGADIVLLHAAPKRAPAGYHGAAVFSNPWCRLLDLNPNRARAMGQEAHRAGLLNLRSVGEVVELTFPLLAAFQGQSA